MSKAKELISNLSEAKSYDWKKAAKKVESAIARIEKAKKAKEFDYNEFNNAVEDAMSMCSSLTAPASIIIGMLSDQSSPSVYDGSELSVLQQRLDLVDQAFDKVLSR